MRPDRGEVRLGGDGVILLHGIGRSARSMARLARALDAAGYRTLNLDYPGRTHDLAAIVEHVRSASTGWIDRLEGKVHLVTHSMGGLVARGLLTRYRPMRLGRVVMLAPPSEGSEIADLLAATGLYRRVFGPAGAQLTTTRSKALTALLGTVDYPVGVIAGDHALDPLGWLVLPKPNDGKVSVARTRLDGMSDHLIVPATHTFIMQNPTAIAAVIGFLAEGRFARRAPRVPRPRSAAG